MMNSVRALTAAIGVVIATGGGAFRAPRPTTLCSATLDGVERSWGGSGDWHSLAPYPVPREASPTDSVGVWLERAHLANGAIELRRVSAAETTVASVDGECGVVTSVHRRTFRVAGGSPTFTDERLRELLSRTGRGMVYVWSPGMPLSVKGIPEARAAAQRVGIAFTAVMAEARPGELAGLPGDARDEQTLNSLDLVYRNANIHYPTVTFYDRGALLGSAVPGYKPRDVYADLARAAFAAGAGWNRTTAPTTPRFWIDRKAKVTTVSSVQTLRPVGFFFKPVPSTSLVSYTSQNQSFLFDLVTRQERRIPGSVDPVATPDGRFVTRPGLVFYPVASLAAGDTTPVFVDTELPDEYQTVSILKQSRDLIRYRVMTGWRMGVRMRDYDVALDRAGKAGMVRPASAAAVPCADQSFSLPISAKSGTDVGAFDTRTNTNRIVHISADGRCIDDVDLGFASGKLAFSYDGAAIAFATSRINVDAEGELLKPDELFYKDALLLYRRTGRMVVLSHNRPLSGMTFPEFLPNGQVIILDQASTGRPVELIRILDVR